MNTLNSLLDWSLQFEVPLWLPLLVALLLALTIYSLGRHHERRLWKTSIEDNARRCRALSIFAPLHTRRP